MAELESICQNYVDRFEASESQPQIAPPIRGRPDLVFGDYQISYQFKYPQPSAILIDSLFSLVMIEGSFLDLRNDRADRLNGTSVSLFSVL